jgi:copper homeostasis protein
MTRALLEIAANSVASALAAQKGGADRIELCENLGDGGTTPSYGTIAISRDRLQIPVYVLIRPRAGDFLYAAAEVEVMCRDIEICVRLGCDGVVVGALDADGAIDMVVCRELIATAGSLGVTFHRAFDAARDSETALETVIALRCERVLTSGGHNSAPEGAESIAALIRQADGRIAIMPGGGIDLRNLPELARRSGAREFHASARRRQTSAMHYRNDQLRGLEPDRQQTAETCVRDLVSALAQLA